MRLRNVYGTSIAAIGALAALAGCSDAAAMPLAHLEKTSIVIDAFPSIDSAGLFIAKQDGLFRAQGLNVTIKLATTSQQAVNGQLAGSYDITSADYVTYIDNVLLGKAPLRIIAESSFLQPNVLALVVKYDSRVQSIGQLKNKIVSVNAPGGIGTLLIDSLLTENGVPLGDVRFNNDVAFPLVGQDLAAGKIGAAFAPQPFVSLAEMQDGSQELADLDQGAATNFPIQGVAVTESWARRNPNTLAAFERAYAAGQKIADTDRAAVEKVIETFLGLPPIAAALVSLPSFPTGVDATRLQRLVDAMVRFSLVGRQYATFNISSIIGSG